MKFTRQIFYLSLILIMAFALTACGGNKETSTIDPANVSEEEYLALSQEHHNAGDFVKEREVLIELHRWYPSKENVARINEVVVEKDATDSVITSLVDIVYTTVENDKAEEVAAMLAGEEWISNMQDSLVGVNRKTKYVDDTYTAQIVSGTYETEVEICKADGGFVYYKWNQAGVVAAKLNYTDGAYNGVFDIVFLNNEGNEIKTYTGEFKNNTAIGEITIEYDGTTFTGELSDTGTTLEKQKDKVTNAGNVVYAYNSSKNKYLYEEDVTVDTFVVDNVYLGIPLYEEW